MLRSKRIASLLLVGVLAATTYGAVRIPKFTGCGTTPDADAMAILNYAQGNDNTIVQVIMNLPLSYVDLEAHIIRSDGATVIVPFFLDGNGVATLHVTIDGDWTDANIEIIDPTAPIVLKYAVGQNPNNALQCTCN